MTEPVTVIIPTLAARSRELECAVRSVHCQKDVEAVPLVVVNGRLYDADLLARLRLRSDIRFHQIGAQSVSRARYEGRKRVDTSFFAFLDDDDELLPDAAKRCLDGMVRAEADVVATNGYVETGGRRQVLFSRFEEHPTDLALALMYENWLAGPGSLYRTDRINEDLFADLPDILEWTFLAFRLAQQYRVRRINELTFVRHEGASDQVSRSWRYMLECPLILARMESLTTRNDLRRHLRRKRSAALHAVSRMALQQGELATAWQYHLRSMAIGRGLRFLSYSRHLITPRCLRSSMSQS